MSEVLGGNIRKSCDTLNGDDTFLNYLLSTKLENNLNSLRRQFLENNLGNEEVKKFQNEFKSAEFNSSLTKHDSLSKLKHQYVDYQESIRRRRYSVDFDSETGSAGQTVDDKNMEIISMESISNDGTCNAQKDDVELSELRKRLLGKRGQPTAEDLDKSAEKQIEDNENIQVSLIEDMTKLVSGLKQGASAFQNALDEDKNVLGAAEVGVQVASRSITDISGKLKSYDKTKLGYLFYITVCLFMILGLILTYIIIKIFPAL
ncbi:hypothetical protein Kpol_1036p53 [Vanderwaltozyma polyspora DSM 70294]|uniref:Uncharacterized protein n=1 Tax=Vanderwaltozyma polyspora (strain ATCC 22028 / DSM 70294 / BCRC 21397 / CBS 2163 / NBRC 10782 / NRRL Y-8283 / UCD 57-17) TaxID=436907 RepID=A7TEK1_VANPO|nr:uncharacterized protein Kpol_1036p53 [Vanderwaltozyma polyspora DSM 70294]EDO19308.1 hypothetical protein Kpol_1036p53 [Vanderwaltozyma polyspora DSM 70294]